MAKKLFLILLLPFMGVSQSSSLNPSISELRDHIYAGVPEHYKDGRTERRAFRFADISANVIKGNLNKGETYVDWPAMEMFLNMVMKKVLPPELRQDSIIHAYLRANGNFNASMTPSGMMFVTTGLIADVPDEATLAAVLAHELAHYYLRHSLKRFMLSQSGYFNDGLLRNHRSQSFSVNNEYSSDSLAMIWYKQSGYSYQGMRNAFSMMTQMDRNSIAKSKVLWEAVENSHPQSDKRLERFEKFIEEEPTPLSGKLFLVSESHFMALKRKASLEALENLLVNFSYDKCIEKAFKLHLLEPNNSHYPYYIVEAIRRKCYLNPTLWGKNFVSSNYFTPVEPGVKGAKIEMEDHLFVKFDPDILCISEDEEKNMLKLYWEDEPLFITYEHAFIFFYRVGRALGNKEVILSNALSITHDMEMRKTLLQEYLEQEDILYRTYADNLLVDQIFGGLRSKKLTLINNFDICVKQGDEFITLDPDKEDELLVRQVLESVFTNYPSRQVKYMDDIRSESMEQYRKLQDMETFSFINIVSQGNRTELHILDPSYWNLFMKYGVNEIEFVNMRLVDSRQSEKSKVAYDSALATTYAEILLAEKRTRHFTVLITSLREKKDCLMKYYSLREYGFRFKPPTNTQLQEIFKDHLDQMEVNVNRADARNREYDGGLGF